MEKINPVIVAKDLGLYLDQSLTYSDHITKTASNCMHKLIEINRIKHLLDNKTLLLLMDSFIFSKLFYCHFTVVMAGRRLFLLSAVCLRFLIILGILTLSIWVSNVPSSSLSSQDPQEHQYVASIGIQEEIFFSSRLSVCCHFGLACHRRKHFLSTRLRYYMNSASTFQLERLVRSGDINPNPGPSHDRKQAKECCLFQKYCK